MKVGNLFASSLLMDLCAAWTGTCVEGVLGLLVGHMVGLVIAVCDVDDEQNAG